MVFLLYHKMAYCAVAMVTSTLMMRSAMLMRSAMIMTSSLMMTSTMMIRSSLMMRSSMMMTSSLMMKSAMMMRSSMMMRSVDLLTHVTKHLDHTAANNIKLRHQFIIVQRLVQSVFSRVVIGRLDHWRQKYDAFIGLTDVNMAQNRVIEVRPSQLPSSVSHTFPCYLIVVAICLLFWLNFCKLYNRTHLHTLCDAF